MPKSLNTLESCNHSDNFVDVCTSALKGSVARITKPRLAVINCLANANGPLSAREIYEIISKNKDLGSIDQVSVYRILEAISKLELIHQVFPSGGYLACFHSAWESMLHVLIRCSSCEEIKELDVPQETVAPMIWYLKKEQSFHADEHVFQMNGLCEKGW